MLTRRRSAASLLLLVVALVALSVFFVRDGERPIQAQDPTFNTAVNSGTASHAIALDVGDNEITVPVNNADSARFEDYTVTITPESAQSTKPDAPDAPAVSRGDGGELVAEWPAPSDGGGSSITGYQLRHSKDGATWTEVSETVAGKRLAIIGSLDNGDEYRVQVRALNSDGNGDWSASGQGTPAAPPVIRVETVVTGVSMPWGLAFAPDGTMMFTERGGRLKVRLVDGTVRTVNADFSDIGADWETGLMGMVVDPDFGVNRHFYTCQGHQDSNTDAQSIQIIKWSMNADYTAATRVKDPLVGGVGIRIGIQWQHAGCRLRFGPQGHLWIATGDGYSDSIDPQDLTNLNGKMLRVNKDTGEGAPGNPFSDNAMPTPSASIPMATATPRAWPGARAPGRCGPWSTAPSLMTRSTC